jgi:hypothetical protein
VVLRLPWPEYRETPDSLAAYWLISYGSRRGTGSHARGPRVLQQHNGRKLGQFSGVSAAKLSQHDNRGYGMRVACFRHMRERDIRLPGGQIGVTRLDGPWSCATAKAGTELIQLALHDAHSSGSHTPAVVEAMKRDRRDLLIDAHANSADPAAGVRS